MVEKVWGGRFKEDMEERFHSFNTSIGFDWRLYPQDIRGSIAHCKALKRAGVIQDEEESAIINALHQIKKDMDSGIISIETSYEDIHTLIEKELVRRVGELGEKLHTARSRNDQVALDLRLFVRESIETLLDKVRHLQVVIVDLAEKYIHLVMPGYTHLQRAQPVLLSHHLMAYYEMFKRDIKRFSSALMTVNILPSGSAALAGTTFSIDRDFLAHELGFDDVAKNSMDAVSDRDFVLEFLFSCALLMMHLSRLSEEIILWATREFSFIELPDSLSTGSSIMPQKKNPDLPELVRGKTGRVYGHLISLLTTMKALPLTYNKDMQEDKEPLFDAFDTVSDCLELMKMLLERITFNREVMERSAEDGFLVATDLAEYLVRKGVPFRRSHEITGRLVLFAMEKGKELKDLELEEMKGFSDAIEEDVYDWLEPSGSIKRRALKGGTSPQSVMERIKEAREELGK
jgi:argininosuccinate lyase